MELKAIGILFLNLSVSQCYRILLLWNSHTITVIVFFFCNFYILIIFIWNTFACFYGKCALGYVEKFRIIYFHLYHNSSQYYNNAEMKFKPLINLLEDVCFRCLDKRDLAIHISKKTFSKFYSMYLPRALSYCFDLQLLGKVM